MARINLPERMTEKQLSFLNMVLDASGYPAVSRRDYLRKFVSIHKEDVGNVLASLRLAGLAA